MKTNNAIVIATLSFLWVNLASAQTPLYTYWEPPAVLSYRIDSNDAVSAPFSDDGHVISIADRVVAMDRACVIWSRTSGVTKRCRSSGTRNVPLGGDGFNPNGSDEFQFHVDATGPAGSTWCHLPFLVLPGTNECDIWMNQGGIWRTYGANTAQDQCAAGNICNTGLTWSAPNRLGSSTSTFHTTLMHEVGHSLGLFHPFACDGTTIDCPVMSVQGDRVSYWPTWHEVQALRSRWGVGARDIQFRLWDVATDGDMVAIDGWTTLDGIASGESPRLSCRPSRRQALPILNPAIIGRPEIVVDPRIRDLVLILLEGAGAPDLTESCILSTNSIHTPQFSQAPGFFFLDVTATSVTASSVLRPTTISEGPVDVAFGSLRRYMGIGKVPTDDLTRSHRIITYRGEVGSEPTSTIHGDATLGGTHTEPRITFHETSGVFVGAWPQRDALVRVASFDLLGNVIDSALLDVRSILPVEIACDNHLPGPIDECQLYIQRNASDASAASGAFSTFRIQIGNTTNGAPTGNFFLNGAGDVISLGTTDSTHVSALLADSATYGNNAGPNQLSGSAFFLSEDRLRSAGTNEVSMRLDSDGLYNPADTNSETQNMGDSQSNTTSWDWNEAARRFVSVRTGPVCCN